MFTEQDALAALPPAGFLRSYVEWARTQTDTPLGFHVGAGLTVLATVAPADLVIPLFGQEITANIFTLFVARSGERKSTALNMGRRLLEASPTTATRIGSEPVSVGGLIDSLADRPIQLITYSEYGTFIQRATDGGHIESVKLKYNDMYDGLRADRGVRAGNKHSTVHAPRLSLMGACADSYLERYTEPTDWTGGHMGRWFVLHAQRERDYPLGGYADPIQAQALVTELERRVQCMSAGPCLGFDTAGEVMWRSWYHDIMNRKIPPKIDGIRTRTPTLALKLCLTLAWDLLPAVEAGQPWEITESVLTHAIALAELHMRSVVAISDMLAESKDMRERRAVMRVLDGHAGPVRYGDIIRESKLLKRRTQEILDTLCEEGTAVSMTIDTQLCYTLRPGVRVPYSHGKAKPAAPVAAAPVAAATAAPVAPLSPAAVVAPSASVQAAPDVAGSGDDLCYWDDPTP